MTERELIERTRKALEEFAKLPPEEQVRQLVARGTINEKGEVLLGRPKGGLNETSSKTPTDVP